MTQMKMMMIYFVKETIFNEFFDKYVIIILDNHDDDEYRDRESFC